MYAVLQISTFSNHTISVFLNNDLVEPFYYVKSYT